MCNSTNKKYALVGTSEVADELDLLIQYIDLIDDAVFDYISSSSDEKRNLGFTLASEMLDKAKNTSRNIMEAVYNIKTIEQIRMECKEEAAAEASA